MSEGIPARPPGVCEACFRIWRVAKPRPVQLRCWHQNLNAELLPDGVTWRVVAGPRLQRRNVLPDASGDREP
jgi:hypothetical protein